ncbi:MAG: hypothetical protein WCV90_06495 [Candidatus Woesearchaeota archaeon]|jgi:uncharacterized protein YqiB (DUF1249 family)
MGIFSALFGQSEMTPLRRLNERVENYEMKIAHLRRLIKTHPTKKELYESQIKELQAEMAYVRRDRSRVIVKSEKKR